MKATLVASAVAIADQDGFAHTSARNVATHAGVAPGVIYYHFGSMDQLLVAALDAATDQRLERLQAVLFDDSIPHWVDRLTSAISREVRGDSGAAALELTIGAKTSPVLAEAARTNTDRSVALVADFCRMTLAGSPMESIVPIDAVAEVAAAAFVGVEVFAQLGRDVDVEQLMRPLAMILAQFDA